MVYENLSYDLKARGIPTLHVYNADGKELGKEQITGRTFDELHELMKSLGFKRKSDDVLAEDVQNMDHPKKRQRGFPSTKSVKVS